MEKKQYNPGIHIPPPLIYIVIFFAGILLQKYFPISRSLLEAKVVQVAARVIAFISPFVAFTAIIKFFKTKNSMIPFKPAKSLQTTGIYSISRNPMYLGLLFLYTGISLMFCNWWNIILIPLVVIVMNNLVIKKEEKYLERAFGQTYLDYKKKVRRWI